MLPFMLEWESSMPIAHFIFEIIIYNLMDSPEKKYKFIFLVVEEYAVIIDAKFKGGEIASFFVIDWQMFPAGLL